MLIHEKINPHRTSRIKYGELWVQGSKLTCFLRTEWIPDPTQHCVGLMWIHRCPHELPFLQVVVYHFILLDQKARALMQNSLLYFIMTIVKALVISTFSINSELNKEFPAIWLVERFVLWRYIHRATRWI